MEAKTLFLFIAALLLSGCALTKQDCAKLDWHQQGLEDGFKGMVARSGYWQSQCQVHGYPVNQSAYSKGWAEGNRQYCTPQQGYRNGTMGNAYQGVCPDKTQDSFLKSYNQGLKVFQRNQYRESLYNRQSAIQSQIIKIDSRLDHNKKLSPDEKDHLRWQRQQLVLESHHIDTILLRMM
ncbi:DUF2799 domain-containing protein [Gallaecimonas mangrovi]|uniref:DUF2799 domain-containing protein n=1 Tax=Gallaecimonas mangrovi TaxID=2291597 RepID=UPI001868B7B2|nr:DUF2799 domain-containing protein [Gallaecimonas mangrovi]